jgi:hypothetical protein
MAEGCQDAPGGACHRQTPDFAVTENAPMADLLAAMSTVLRFLLRSGKARERLAGFRPTIEILEGRRLPSGVLPLQPHHARPASGDLAASSAVQHSHATGHHRHPRDHRPHHHRPTARTAGTAASSSSGDHLLHDAEQLAQNWLWPF